MKKIVNLLMFAGILLLAMDVYSQKGMGDKKGNSRRGLVAEVVNVSGTVEDVEVGPCKYTTGKSVSGTHLLVKTADDETLNIHLGPTSEVTRYITDIEGTEIELKAFQTEKLPSDHYIAKEIIRNGKIDVLRDETLRPIWAGNNRRNRR